MKTRNLEFYTLSNLIVLCASLISTGPLAAQNSNTYDLQIMVNGPWDYAPDPDSVGDCKDSSGHRIVLVAPAMNGADKIHEASIFSGTAASQTPPATALHPDASAQGDLALYCLNIDRGAVSPQANPHKDEPANFYASQQTISKGKLLQVIQPGVNGHPDAYRFAISLPRPDYVTTYAGSYGSGFAESKVQTGTVAPETHPDNYTVWAVLHYAVPSATRQIDWRKFKSLGGLPVPQPSVPVGTDDSRSGVTIAMTELLPSNGDEQCDTVSGISFSSSMKMWHLAEHARFPVQRSTGGQYPGYYLYAVCDESHGLDGDVLEAKLSDMTRYNNDIRDKIGHLSENLRELLKEPKPSRDLEGESLRLIAQIRKQLQDGPSGRQLTETANHALACLTKLLSTDKDLQTAPYDCPAVLSPPLIREYLASVAANEKGGSVSRSVGRADCHKAQVSINGVLP
jgi:hypothetical protein